MKHLNVFNSVSEYNNKKDSLKKPYVTYIAENKGLDMNDNVKRVAINNQDKSVDITENGSIELFADGGYTGLGKVIVNTNVASGDTPSSHGSDVNFRDCDGTLLYSYSKDQFLALTELPPLPTREGLICQGWNWDLEDAQSYVRDYGKQEIGATYITDDGKTRLYINITSEYITDVSLCFKQTKSDGVIIDWGDGSPMQTLSSSGKVSTTHVYSNIGTYIISLEVIEGCELYLGHESQYSGTILGKYSSSNWTRLDKLTAVEIGKNVPAISPYAFYACRKLSFITIPERLYIGKEAFYDSNIYYVSIPKYAIAIEVNAFYSCKSLVYISIPQSVWQIQSGAFLSCSSLYSVFLPETVTAIEEDTFSDCNSLTSITISKNLTKIGTSAFSYCASLLSIPIPATTNSYGLSIFQYSGLCDIPPINNFNIADLFKRCENLTKVNITEGTTVIGARVFKECYNISSVFIPEGVTTINSSAFAQCYSLIHVEFPSTITTIESQAFSDCYGKRVFDFRKSTLVPTMAYYMDFNVDGLKIVVPDSLYDEWISATNWASVASKIVKASEFNA